MTSGPLFNYSLTVVQILATLRREPMRNRFSLICLFVILSSQRMEAQAKPLATEPAIPLLQGKEAPLKGMRRFTFRVSTDSTYPDTEGLRTNLELKMRQAGITISPYGAPIVVLTCLASRITTLPIRVVQCEVTVSDYVSRTVPIPQRFLAEIWRYQRISTVGDNTFAASYEDNALSTFDGFMNAWYKANQAP